MIQCKDCEFCEIAADGRKSFKCDPFSNIKEPECIGKLQLLRLDMLLASYRSMLGWYEQMGPMQQKIFKYVQRELDDIKGRIDGNPCVEHGLKLAKIEQAEQSGLTWKKITLSVWMVILTGVVALVAYGEYIKK